MTDHIRIFGLALVAESVLAAWLLSAVMAAPPHYGIVAVELILGLAAMAGGTFGSMMLLYGRRALEARPSPIRVRRPQR